MAKVESMICDEALIDRLIEEKPHLFGVGFQTYYRDGKVVLEGGNSAQRARVFGELRGMIEAAKNVVSASDAATEKQISYLRDLIRRDPGNASNFGLTVDNVAELTKAQASKMIDMLR